MASLEVDLTKIEVGQTITVKWRGKPVFIRRRSEDEIHTAESVNLASLRDPQPDSDRVTDPQVGSQAAGPAFWLMHRAARCLAALSGTQQGVLCGGSPCQGCAPEQAAWACSGWWWWACARTWAACHCRALVTSGAGSALVMAATTMCQGVRARALPPPTWWFQSTSSWMTTPCRLDRCRWQRDASCRLGSSSLGSAFALALYAAA